MKQDQSIFMFAQEDGSTFSEQKHRYYDTFTSIFVSHKFTRKEILAGKDVLSACTQHKGGH